MIRIFWRLWCREQVKWPCFYQVQILDQIFFEWSVPPYDQGANWLGVFFLTFLMGLLIRYLETLTIQNVFLFLLRTNLWIKEENLWTFPFYGPLNTSYRPTHGCATATTLGDWPFFATCVAKAKVKPSNLFFQTTSGSNACKFFNI
jgi:hypothetical protein